MTITKRVLNFTGQLAEVSDMLIKINRQDAINKFPNLPLRHYNPKEDEDVFDYPKVFANYVLTLPSKSYKGHIKLLAAELVNLMKNLKANYIVCMGDVNIAWLRRLNTYENFQEALQYLVDNKIGKRFNGALQVTVKQLPIFIKHLAWLGGQMGSYPTFTSLTQDKILSETFANMETFIFQQRSRAADKSFKDAIAKSSFTYLTDGSCYNKSSKSGAIKGRTIIV